MGGGANATALVNVTWQPPPVQWWDFNITYGRCDAATDWGADMFVAIKNNPTLVLGNDVSSNPVDADKIIRYVRAMAPSNDTSMDDVLDSAIIAWYYQVWYDDNIEAIFNKNNETLNLMNEMLAFPILNCTDYRLLCQKIDWKADSDVSGRGMLVTYYFIAAMATIYLAFLTLGRHEAFRAKHSKPITVSRWIVRCFNATVNSFLDSGLLFTIAIVGATIVRFNAIHRHPKQPYSVYGLLGSTAMSSFSICVTIMLHMISHARTNFWVRRFLWLVVIALSITLEVYYRQMLGTWDLSNDTEKSIQYYVQDHPTQITDLLWMDQCDQVQERLALQTMLDIRLALFGINFLAFVSLTYTYCFGQPKWFQRMHQGSSFPARVLRIVAHYRRMINAVMCGIFMWLLLALFHSYRNDVMGTSAPDDSVQRRTELGESWSFGQVLALATFAPVVLDLLNVIIYGAEQGLSGKLSDEYKVVAREPRESSNEKENYLPTSESEQERLQSGSMEEDRRGDEHA